MVLIPASLQHVITCYVTAVCSPLGWCTRAPGRAGCCEMGQLSAGLHPEGRNDSATLKLNPGRVFCLALDRRWSHCVCSRWNRCLWPQRCRKLLLLRLRNTFGSCIKCRKRSKLLRSSNKRQLDIFVSTLGDVLSPTPLDS